jgi:hypothetical protein
MRRVLLTLIALCVAAPLARAQGFVGRWEVRNQQGGITTLLLTDGGNHALGGTFSGNGNSFAVMGTANADEATGTIAGRGLTLFFQAQVKGSTLLLVVAEPGPTGTPNLNAAQQILMTRANGEVSSLPPAKAPAAPPASATGAGGSTALDRQMIQLLTANAWCAFSYSGSQTYSSSSGTSRTERVMLTRDGIARSNQRSESGNSGANGSVTGQSDAGSTGRWRFDNGVLAFSADGVTWQPANFKMTFNSNGSPIPVVNGKEYMVCN